MTPAQLAELNTELTTDPAALGYAPYLNISDNECAALLNALTGPGAVTISLPSQTKGAILKGCVPGTDQLATGVNLSGVAISAATTNKWLHRFNAIRSGDPVLALDTEMMGLLGQLVTDGLMTQAQIDAITKRVGSRAEYLWGAGTVVQPSDVMRAMGRGL